MAQIGQGAAAIFGVGLGLATLMIVPHLVAACVATESERGTLGPLLTTPLSSAEIVLGKLTAALLVYASALLASLPVSVLLCLLGGVDPRWILLGYGVIASTGLMLSAFAIFASVSLGQSRQATRRAMFLASFWLVWSSLLMLILPTLAPRWAPWILPVLDWIASSSPLMMVLSLIGAPVLPFRVNALATMFGLQTAYMLAFIALAIWRLRPAFRARQGGEASSSTRKRLRWRFRLVPRPACGDDPILWKDVWVGNRGGLAQLFGLLMILGLGWGLADLTYRFAAPAWREVLAFGHGVGSDDRRLDFNGFLRALTVGISLIYILVTAGMGAESIVRERMRETWTSLLLTPLEGREILRAKKRAIVWKTGPLLIGLALFWGSGLVVGSVHPIGYVVAIVVLGLSTWLIVEIGIHASLVSPDLPKANNRALLPVLAITFGVLGTLIPTPFQSVCWGIGSIPFLTSIALISYRDWEALLHPSLGTWSFAGPLGQTPWPFLAVLLLSMIGFAAAATWLNRRGADRFDRIVGRPVRSGRGEVVANATHATSPAEATPVGTIEASPTRRSAISAFEEAGRPAVGIKEVEEPDRPAPTSPAKIR